MSLRRLLIGQRVIQQRRRQILWLLSICYLFKWSYLYVADQWSVLDLIRF